MIQLDQSEVNTIVTSFNRNFPKRNDGNANTKAFLTSPDMVLLYALAGTLDFDPLPGAIKTDSGDDVSFEPPMGEDLPRMATTGAVPVTWSRQARSDSRYR